MRWFERSWKRAYVLPAAEICSGGGSWSCETTRSRRRLGACTSTPEMNRSPLGIGLGNPRWQEPGAISAAARCGRIFGRAHPRGPGVDRSALGRRDTDPHVGSSIYPAVQNMLLAARALGLGATLTTLYLQFEEEAEAALPCRPVSTPMPCCRSASYGTVRPCSPYPSG